MQNPSHWSCAAPYGTKRLYERCGFVSLTPAENVRQRIRSVVADFDVRVS